MKTFERPGLPLFLAALLGAGSCETAVTHAITRAEDAAAPDAAAPDVPIDVDAADVDADADVDVDVDVDAKDAGAEGCALERLGSPTSCKSDDVWRDEIERHCARSARVARDVSLVEPCEATRYRYVKAACCPPPRAPTDARP